MHPRRTLAVVGGIFVGAVADGGAGWVAVAETTKVTVTTPKEAECGSKRR